jgi:hypothetical protein
MKNIKFLILIVILIEIISAKRLYFKIDKKQFNQIAKSNLIYLHSTEGL